MYIFSNFLFVQKYKFTKSLSRYIIKIYNIYNFACADVSCEEDFTSSFFGEAPPAREMVCMRGGDAWERNTHECHYLLC